MPLQSVTLQMNIPEGHEVTGEVRPAKEKEPWMTATGQIYHGASFNPQIILRKKFALPEWVKPGTWYAMDADGDEYFYRTKPNMEHGHWEYCGLAVKVRRELYDFPSAPTCDWKDSLVQQTERGTV